MANLCKFIALLIFLSNFAFAEYKRPISWSGNLYKIVQDYTTVHKDFFKKMCSPNDYATYNKLIRKYRGQGYYLPKYKEKIDLNAIKKNLHFYEKKIAFINSGINKLTRDKEYLKFSHAKNELDKIVENLLILKKQYFFKITKEDKKRILNQSRLEIKRLKKQFLIFIDQLYFMKSFNFPNNFLSYRQNYEKYRFDENLKDDKRANEIFFFRKIVEDGAFDPGKTRPDKFIRTALDTLYLNIQKEKDFISEDVRYDLEWLEGKLERIVQRGKKVQIKRLNEWLSRTKKTYLFYKELVATKNKKKADFLVQKENEAARELRNFVYKKQADVYKYWTDKKELFKALFVLETILVHEVGVLDGKHGLERINVAKVVLNRYQDNFYNQLEKDQAITKFLKEYNVDTEKEKWLNVLFKIGEFSFTYHYIPAVSGIHCPDMSRRGKAVRKQNLKFALKTIKSHDGSFNAFRYFSRVSMLGKIDMSTVWTEYKRLPEMPGYLSEPQRRLVHKFYADRYQYLYSYTSSKGVVFNVIKMKDKIYAMTWKKGIPVFHDHRNPHYFKYFSKKN